MENKTKEEREADLELADCMKEADIECMINEIGRASCRERVSDTV